jgi:hypothetical protein
MNDREFVEALYLHVADVPAARRCQVFWTDLGYGRHMPRKTRDGEAAHVPHNVCNREFLSHYPATVCGICAERMAVWDRKIEETAKARADAAAAEAGKREFNGYSKQWWRR